MNRVSPLLCTLAVGALLGVSASAQGLRITEVMFMSSHPPLHQQDHNYWWELTNFGAAPVSLDGYSWDDNNPAPGAFPFPSGITLAPGESIIIVERPDPSTAVADFRAAWGPLVDGVQILSDIEFVGPPFPGLGLGGEIYLFDPSGALVDSQGPVPPPIVGVSNEYLPPDFVGRASVAGESGAYPAPGADPGDVGSPGFAPVHDIDLRITEIMFVSSHPPAGDPPQYNYWWELTNFGAATADLQGYSWDDNSAVPGEFVFPAGVTVAPGESIIIIQRVDPNTAVSDFRAAWALLADDVQVLSAVEFGVPTFPGLGLGGVIYLFHPSSALADSRGPVPTPIEGVSNEYLPPDFVGRQSVECENGARRAPCVDPGDIGSPGRISEAGLPPCLCLGDSNCDGYVDWRDIDFFAAAMNNNEWYWRQQFQPCAPTCSFYNNDTNGDGIVTWRDIDPFVGRMNTTCTGPWAQLTNSGPPVRLHYGLAHDPDRDVTILYGGYDNGAILNDLWEFGGSGWTLRSSDGPPRMAHAMRVVTDKTW